MNSLTSAVTVVIADPVGRILLCQQSQGAHQWALPGGTVRHNESPVHAAMRDVREEIGADVTMVELIGLYQLTGLDLPDVTVHVFRGRLDSPVNARPTWHNLSALPSPMTETTLVALEDAVTGRSGTLRTIRRAAELVLQP